MVFNPHARKKTILVAGNESHDIFSIQKLLQEEGYDVFLARNGEESIEIYNSNKSIINLLVMDVVMVKKGGLAVYEELSKFDPNILFLIMSGFPVESFENLKNIFFIRKPMYPHELLTCIKQILDDSTLDMRSLFHRD